MSKTNNSLLPKGASDNNVVQTSEDVVQMPEEIDSTIQPTVEEQYIPEEAISPVEGTYQEPSVIIEQITQPIIEAQQDNTFETKIKNILKNDSNKLKHIVSFMEEYKNNMSPGVPITGNIGARYQYNLLILLKNIINTETEFKEQWTLILNYFNEYSNGIFADRYIYRFSEDWSKSNDDLLLFQRLINLIKLTCNIESRAKGLKQVSLAKTLEIGLTELGKNNIITFYNR